MIPLSNLHSHSQFSDGAHTLEEMVQAAIAKNFVSFGFSEHAWTPYDADCCIKAEDIPLYLVETARLKIKYQDMIEIYTGFEVDAYYDTPKTGLDFTIGSVHYLRSQAGEYFTIDYLPHHLESAREQVASGNIRTLVEQYYDLLVCFADRYHPDMIGHLDLITKLNSHGRYFDESSDWYQNLMHQTAERIAATGCLVEVNTGGMFRGYKDVPYPSPSFLNLLHAYRVPLTISSDAHATDGIDYYFSETAALLQEIGYRTIWQMHKGTWTEIAL